MDPEGSGLHGIFQGGNAGDRNPSGSNMDVFDDLAVPSSGTDVSQGTDSKSGFVVGECMSGARGTYREFYACLWIKLQRWLAVENASPNPADIGLTLLDW